MNGIKKVWHIHTMECYSAPENEGIPLYEEWDFSRFGRDPDWSAFDSKNEHC